MQSSDSKRFAMRLYEAHLSVGVDLKENPERFKAVTNVFYRALSEFDYEDIDQAFNVFEKTNKYPKITPGAIVELIPNKLGHLDPEEAWNRAPKSEAEGEYVTDQIMLALGAAQPSIDNGDMIAGRMAFVECYKKSVMECVSKGVRAKYFYSGATEGEWEQRRQIEEDRTLEAAQRGLIPVKQAWPRLQELAGELGKDPAVHIQKLKSLPGGSDLLRLENKSKVTPEQAKENRAKIHKLLGTIGK